MTGRLIISLGQASDKGVKDINQDFHGALVPDGDDLTNKGIAVAIADGISSSRVSHIAAESAVKSFLTDYYCTSASWTVKTSVSRVIAATNSWLHAQTLRGDGRYNPDLGYVTTFSALVFKSTTAHLFHIGDARIYRLSGSTLEQLTTDHRVSVSASQSYLGRALGMKPELEIDYVSVQIASGDVFVLATDGVHAYLKPEAVARSIATSTDLDATARDLVALAVTAGSDDNLTIQIARVDDVPHPHGEEVAGRASALPPAPLLTVATVFEGYRILRPLHSNSRSHIYLAEDIDTGTKVALKVPSVDLRGDATYLKRFMMEEWAARRIENPHVLRAHTARRPHQHAYVVMEFVEGQTLTQWMRDNPQPDVEAVRGIVEQIARGLRAFHRLEMLHQDVRPENIMIDRNGTVKILDFGSVRIAGVLEASPSAVHGDMLGTAQYTAPEYLVGDAGSELSDLYALGVITYQMLTGDLPFGARMAQAPTRQQQARVAYVSAAKRNPKVPTWLDGAIEKAVNPNPGKRQQALSEFTHDLRVPRADLVGRRPTPLLERNPVAVWQGVSALLLGIVILQLLWR